LSVREVGKPKSNREFAEARKKAGLAGLIFHDPRRIPARNMIRGGVPQSVAMRVTGHRSDSMFRRYDVASLDDKLEALRRAREYAATRAAVGGNVTPFPKDLSTHSHNVDEKAGVSEGVWLGGKDSNPERPANAQQTLPTAQKPDPQKTE
jgi:hypothetical protein